MIAMLELEVFTSGAPGSQMRTPLQGTAPWVAEIKGLNRDGYFIREFQRGELDYSRANSTGSRGIHRYYHLRSGRIYEVAERLSWKRQTQYFCRVTQDGDIVRLTRQEVLAALQGTQHAEVKAIARGIADE